MYSKAHQWELAHKVACTFMSPKEVSDLYIKQAKDLEAKGQLKDAEALYLTIKEHDLAISMYKNSRQYDQMIKLVSIYHKDLLSKLLLFLTCIADTHLFLGKMLEEEGNFRLAEHHYIEGLDFKAAINMFCVNNMFEDAYRVF